MSKVLDSVILEPIRKPVDAASRRVFSSGETPLLRARRRFSDRFLLQTAFGAGLIALISATSFAAETLDIAVATNGLSRLAWAGTDLLKDGKPQVKRVTFEHEKLDAQNLNTCTFDKLDGANPKVSFDRETESLTYTYAWGSARFVYRPGADRLGMTVEITNKSTLPIADFEVVPLTLAFPNPPKKPEHGNWIETPPDRLGVIEASCGGEKLLLCCESMVPLNFGLASGGQRESAVILKGGVQMMGPGGVSFHTLGLPRVAPGESLAITFSLRFATAEAAKQWVVEASNREILADMYNAFRKYHRPGLAWKDRRPIGTVFVGGGKGPSNNPRNWFQKADLDVRTPEGKVELRKLFMEYADRCIKALKNTNAQGVIVWDPEGSENPHPITYIGDPRMVKILAPEVEDIYPDFFKRFRDAGLRTGCCLRPTQVYFDAKDKKWAHGTGSHGPERNPLGDDFSKVWPKGLPWWRFYPVVERLCRKIDYAKKNWGCTIFYVDSNGVFAPLGEKQEFAWLLLESNVWREVLQRHPDVLLIPELPTWAPATWVYTASYLQPPYTSTTTPAYLWELLPGSFSVCQSVNLSPTDWSKRRGEMLEGVTHGDSMFFRGWFDDDYNAKIRRIYDEANKPGAIKPQ